MKSESAMVHLETMVWPMKSNTKTQSVLFGKGYYYPKTVTEEKGTNLNQNLLYQSGILSLIIYEKESLVA